MHTYIRTNIRTYIDTHIRTYITCLRPCIPTSLHADMPKYLHTYTSIHTQLRTYCRGTTSHPTKGCLIQAPQNGLHDAPNYFIYVLCLGFRCQERDGRRLTVMPLLTQLHRATDLQSSRQPVNDSHNGCTHRLALSDSEKWLRNPCIPIHGQSSCPVPGGKTWNS